jgi:hypothetical protein
MIQLYNTPDARKRIQEIRNTITHRRADASPGATRRNISQNRGKIDVISHKHNHRHQSSLGLASVGAPTQKDSLSFTER